MLRLRDVDEAARLDHAEEWLASAVPDLSSKTLLSRSQRNWLIVIGVIVVAGLVLAPTATCTALVGLATLVYLCIVVHRVAMTLRSLRHPNLVIVTDEEARAASDESLPIYTVLVPVYQEAAVLPHLIANLENLDYPRDRLDLKILVEQDDTDTLAAALATAPDHFEIIVVPGGEPRTKPKALNYGVTAARGELLTIFDAEDRPEPLQLRRAAIAFSRLPDDVGCLQARLAYWNADQNLITRWFAIEYEQWFNLLLPGLAAGGAPVPLGGTSNHIRRSTLEAVGAWDPYNVTEDADLGVRLHRCGYRSAVLASETLEEANSDYVNWNKQRSRWYKGYLQTWIVHMRHPVRLLDELGWGGFLEFNAFVGGTPMLALINPLFWALTIVWFAAHLNFIESIYPTAIYYPALACFVAGNASVAYLFLISARLSKRPGLVSAAVLVPLYWVMMSIAAIKAFWQLVVARSFWEKTAHGLAVPTTDGPSATAGASRQTEAHSSTEFSDPGPPELALGLSAQEERRPRRPSPALAMLAPVLRLAGVVVLATVVCVVVVGPLVPEPSIGDAIDRPVDRSPADGSVIAKLSIPSIGLSEPIVEGVGTHALDQAVGHVRGSSLPGQSGDAVIVGHRYAARRQFLDLVRVRVGATIIVDLGGGRATYEVVRVGETARGDFASSRSAQPTLDLVTGASAVRADRLIVVEGVLQASHRVAYAGSENLAGARILIPGTNSTSVAVALLLLAVVVGSIRWLVVRGRALAVITRLLLWLVLLSAAFELVLTTLHALPPTF